MTYILTKQKKLDFQVSHTAYV